MLSQLGSTCLNASWDAHWWVQWSKGLAADLALVVGFAKVDDVDVLAEVGLAAEGLGAELALVVEDAKVDGVRVRLEVFLSAKELATYFARWIELM